MANNKHTPKKLTEAAVNDMRANYKSRTKGFSVPDLAKKHGVSTQTVTSIIKRKTWTHLPDPVAPVTSPTIGASLSTGA